jgi:hypothetical protein
VQLDVDEREELKRLRKEVHMLRMDRDFEKSRCVLREGNDVSTGLFGITQNAGQWFNQCCRLGVRRSAYYNWRGQPVKVIPS